MDTKLQIITVIGIAIILMILFIATSYAKNDFKSDEEYYDDKPTHQDETSDYHEDNDEAEMLYEATSKSFKLNHMQMDAFNKMSDIANKHFNSHDD